MVARGRPAPGAALVDPAARAALAPLLAEIATGCAVWTGRDLGQIYESLLDAEARHQTGIYYTPAPIIESILAATLDPLLAAAQAHPAPLAAISAIRVLDPACGAGYFLEAAAARIAAAMAEADPAGRPASWWAGPATAGLHGIDCDPVAIQLAHYSLYLYTATSTGRHPGPRLHTGDALAPLPRDWDRFDAVVGNPPYISHRAQPAVQKRAYRADFRTARGQYDLAGLFIERGLGLLRPGGVLGYIVPNKFMAAEYGQPLRVLLADEASLLRLEDVSRRNLFPGAAAYPVILVARRQPPPPAHCVSLVCAGRPATVLPQAALLPADGSPWPAATSPDLLALAAHLERQPGRLPADAIRCGIARSGYTRAGIPAARYTALAPAAQAGYLPLLQAQDITPYAVAPQSAALYLARATLTPAERAAIAGPKVLVPGIARRLCAAYTVGGTALGRVYYVNDGTTAYDPSCLLALLNARLLGWYYRYLYWPAHLAGGYLRINGPYLTRLPLPPPDAPLADLGALARALAADPGAAGPLQPALDAAVCRLYGILPADLQAAEAVLADLTGAGS